MKNQWNYPLIWKTVKIMMALAIFLFVVNSCSESNPLETQEDNLTTMSSRAPDIINPGDLP